MNYDTVINFWFNELTPEQHFRKDENLDKLIIEKFSGIHAQAIRGELFTWRRNALGRLAEIIVIDQFSRNMFRGTKESFAYDTIALVLAQEAVHQKIDQELTLARRAFMYMPYMHSESKSVHEEAVELFSVEGLENNFQFELKHKVIIDRFGRYPHRNEILGRVSTPEEIEFLQGPDSSF